MTRTTGTDSTNASIELEPQGGSLSLGPITLSWTYRDNFAGRMLELGEAASIGFGLSPAGIAADLYTLGTGEDFFTREEITGFWRYEVILPLVSEARTGVEALRGGTQGPSVPTGRAVKVDRHADGLEARGRPLTSDQARRSVDRGDDVYVRDRATVEAVGGRRAVGPEIYPRSGEVRFPHVHRPDRRGGHIVYGEGQQF